MFVSKQVDKRTKIQMMELVEMRMCVWSVFELYGLGAETGHIFCKSRVQVNRLCLGNTLLCD